MKSLLLVPLAMVMFIATAQAGGLYIEGSAGGDIDAGFSGLADNVEGAIAVGLDTDRIRPEVAYTFGNGRDDTLAVMIWLDLAPESIFTPYIGAGAGAPVDDIAKMDTGDAFWIAAAGASIDMTEHIALTATYSYSEEFKTGNNDRRLIAGVRLTF